MVNDKSLTGLLEAGEEWKKRRITGGLKCKSHPCLLFVYCCFAVLQHRELNLGWNLSTVIPTGATEISKSMHGSVFEWKCQSNIIYSFSLSSLAEKTISLFKTDYLKFQNTPIMFWPKDKSAMLPFLFNALYFSENYLYDQHYRVIRLFC